MPLSKRQAEAMRWICEGKTFWETATILGVSHNAIADRLRRAKAQLGACNITHAAVLFDRMERSKS